MKIMWSVGIGGMVGATLRYLLSLGIAQVGVSFPLATLVTNWLGCFLLAWFIVWTNQYLKLALELRVGIGTGLIGSFTTMSTFSVEMVQLFQQGDVLVVCFYGFLSLSGGLLLVLVGFKLGSTKKKREEI
ncbi:CrcB family protein [Mechercharimyces sp. CAU 1602]|uniref:fluoride efflux transporter FluC n=1 Tax=Mechercharimyces sp. CAU 1602 TaxID=2973933 RepID=UPI0021614A63|nr:CrcB family protein [Mechercharimyces sp. CAU 1602]MCS1350982.1 CrcB family protein [Mechercharimyces sp. CAU 1602]